MCVSVCNIFIIVCLHIITYLKSRDKLGEEGAASLELDWGSNERREDLLVAPSFPVSPTACFSDIFTLCVSVTLVVWRQ